MTVEDTMTDPRRLPRCLACGASTQWKTRARDGSSFVGCSRYSKCRGSLSVAQLAKMLAKRSTAATLAARRRRSAATRAVTPATGDGSR